MKKKRSFTFGSVFMIVIYALAGAMCGYFGFGQLDRGFGIGGFLAVYLLIIAALTINILLHIIIHEGGHLIFGLLSGYKFVSFRIGSLMFIKTPDGIKPKRFSIMGTGGQCLLDPPELNEDGSFPYMLYNLGGSIMNIISANIGLFLSHLIGKNTYFGYFFLSFAIIGGAVALTNAVPLRLGEVNNDGYNALNLGKNKGALYAFYCQLKINAAVSEGKRLKDMPDHLFDSFSTSQMTDALTSAVGVFRFSRLTDMGKLDEAAAYGRTLLSQTKGMLGIHRWALTGELLFLELIGENRREVIERLYTPDVKRYLNASKKSPSSARTLYAYEKLFKGDEKTAAKYLTMFEKSLKTHPGEGEKESEKELFDLIKSK